jgi:serine/threonine-protein kinase
MLTGEVPYSGDTPVEIAMKHLNETPRPPSARAPEIPADLDRIVLRALAKSPEDRYGSAEELDSDLARVEAGLPIARETAEAATAVLAGVTSSGAPTQVLQPRRQAPPPAPPPRRPPPYDPYGGRPPRRKRSIFPWILVIVLLAAAAIAGWYVYQQVQDQLEESKPVPVPNVVGIRQQLAIQQIERAGLEADVRRRADDEAPAGEVVDQNPAAGTRISKGETVVITVSTGVEQVVVPRVANLSVAEATSVLDEAGLRWEIREVFSDRVEAGFVISQDPKPDAEVAKGSVITLRVSRGIQNVAVPDVLQQDQASAEAELAEAGFEVSVIVVASDEPSGLVVDQSPSSGIEAPKGSVVEIAVSEGPQLDFVPNIVGLDQGSAISTLEGAGFGVDVIEEPTLDPGQDFLVVDQSPAGDTEAAPGSTVTIVVLRFVVEEPPPVDTDIDG